MPRSPVEASRKDSWPLKRPRGVTTGTGGQGAGGGSDGVVSGRGAGPRQDEAPESQVTGSPELPAETSFKDGDARFW